MLRQSSVRSIARFQSSSCHQDGWPVSLVPHHAKPHALMRFRREVDASTVNHERLRVSDEMGRKRVARLVT